MRLDQGQVRAVVANRADRAGRAIEQSRPGQSPARDEGDVGDEEARHSRTSRGINRPSGIGNGDVRMRLLRDLNGVVTRHIRSVEMVGVLMRIFSFSLVSWLGPASPFMFVWAFNTVDAIMLAWCAIIKKDRAYSVLNVFWVGVGLIGMVRAAGFAYP